VSIQEEIHKAMNDLQKKNSNDLNISKEDMTLLFLTSLLEEEAPNVKR